MRKLEDAIRRQQAVQRSRTLAWALFAVFVPVAILFWLEAVFALVNISKVGMLQLLAELILALLFTFAAIQMFRNGVRFNRLVADPSRLLEPDADMDQLKASSWSIFLPFSFWSD